MTRRDKLLEQLFAEWEQLDEAGKMTVYQFAKQDHRAATFGLSVELDKSTGFFFVEDPVTKTVIAPPPMNLETVRAWLDDYEKEATEE